MVEYPELEAAPAPPADHRIAYGADPALQYGELRLPAGAGPCPVAVVVHGGCWRSEYDLAHLRPLAAALTRAGVATWLLEYRRVGDPGGGWPGTFEDVARGADHVRALARDHPLDPARAVLVGHSAGGHLALWLVHGALDGTVPPALSRELAARARAAGDDAAVEIVEGAGHFDVVASFAPAWATVERAVLDLAGEPAAGAAPR